MRIAWTPRIHVRQVGLPVVFDEKVGPLPHLKEKESYSFDPAEEM